MVPDLLDKLTRTLSKPLSLEYSRLAAGSPPIVTNSLMVAVRVDFAEGLDDSALEETSDRIDRRLREVVPDVTEVFLDATTGPRRPPETPRSTPSHRPPEAWPRGCLRSGGGP